MEKSDLFWQTYLNIEKEFLSVADVVYVSDRTRKIDSSTGAVKYVSDSHQLFTYSPYLADLLVRCCIQIEAISKELYFENGGTKARGTTDLYFDTDCINLIESKWHVGDKGVVVSCSKFELADDQNINLCPLKKANKRSKAYWAECYQAVKHDRYNNLYLGNITSCLHALAALYLLNIYYRNEKIVVSRSNLPTTDLSFGSSVFSVRSPEKDFVDNVVNGRVYKETLQSSISPYVLKYTDDSYERIIASINSSKRRRIEYLNRQPEMQDPEFITEFFGKVSKFEENPAFRFDYFVELHQFRLNKRIPKTLPFEERKRLLVESPEWNGSVRRNNKHLAENELTEQNIQSEIDLAAQLMAYEVSASFERERLANAFEKGYCEMVLDKGDVKYPDLEEKKA